MYYGHASWIVLVVFAGMFAFRALSSQRRRGAGGTRPPGSALSGQDRFHPDQERVPGSPGPEAASTGTPPGWFTDPFCKHDQRYWSGSAWTEHVSDDGVPGTDPPPPPPPNLGDAG